MESKQKNELDFWKWLYSTKDDYLEFRKQDAKEKMKHFDISNRNGIGIDVGCGLISVFNGLSNRVVAIDPLLEGYNEIIKHEVDNIRYIEASGEDIPFKEGYFDYAFCVNVIDHTPNPKKMADEIKRVVRKGGNIYFEVNFDDVLSPCHYELWNKEKVKEMFGDLKLIKEVEERNEKDKQTLYHAIYENICIDSNL